MLFEFFLGYLVEEVLLLAAAPGEPMAGADRPGVFSRVHTDQLHTSVAHPPINCTNTNLIVELPVLALFEEVSPAVPLHGTVHIARHVLEALTVSQLHSHVLNVVDSGQLFSIVLPDFSFCDVL